MSTLDTSVRDRLVSRLRASIEREAADQSTEAQRRQHDRERSAELGRAAALVWVASEHVTSTGQLRRVATLKVRDAGYTPAPLARRMTSVVGDAWRSIFKNAGPLAEEYEVEFAEGFVAGVVSVWDDVKSEVERPH